MTVTASELVPAETAAGKDDMWMPPALFLHDWSTQLVLRSSWATNVANVQSAGEVRAGLSPKPSRSIDVCYTALGPGETALLRSWINRMAMARTPVPLFCDQTLLTVGATVGSMTLVCNTASRRFFVGGLAAIWPATAKTVALAFDMAVIASCAAGSITLATGLVNGYSAGDLVAPVMEADLIGQLSATYVTDSAFTAQLTFRETVGAMTLDPAAAAGSVPEGVESYLGLPIFALPLDWSGAAGEAGAGSSSGASDSGMIGGAYRVNETTQVGLVNYTEVHGSRYQASQTVSVFPFDRDEAWAVEAFFDSRGGRQKPFLAVDASTDFVAAGTIGAGSTTVSLVAGAPLLDWQWRTHLAFVLDDDSIVVRAIAGATRSGDTDLVALASALPTLSAPVARLALAFVARFGTDELQETWTTDSIMFAQLPQAELVNEESIDLDHLPAAPTGGGLRAPVPGAGGGSGGGSSGGSSGGGTGGESSSGSGGGTSGGATGGGSGDVVIKACWYPFAWKLFCDGTWALDPDPPVGVCDTVDAHVDRAFVDPVKVPGQTFITYTEWKMGGDCTADGDCTDPPDPGEPPVATLPIDGCDCTTGCTAGGNPTYICNSPSYYATVVMKGSPADNSGIPFDPPTLVDSTDPEAPPIKYHLCYVGGAYIDENGLYTLGHDDTGQALTMLTPLPGSYFFHDTGFTTYADLVANYGGAGIDQRCLTLTRQPIDPAEAISMMMDSAGHTYTIAPEGPPTFVLQICS